MLRKRGGKWPNILLKIVYLSNLVKNKEKKGEKINMESFMWFDSVTIFRGAIANPLL